MTVECGAWGQEWVTLDMKILGRSSKQKRRDLRSPAVCLRFELCEELWGQGQSEFEYGCGVDAIIPNVFNGACEPDEYDLLNS